LVLENNNLSYFAKRSIEHQSPYRNSQTHWCRIHEQIFCRLKLSFIFMNIATHQSLRDISYSINSEQLFLLYFTYRLTPNQFELYFRHYEKNYWFDCYLKLNVLEIFLISFKNCINISGLLWFKDFLITSLIQIFFQLLIFNCQHSYTLFYTDFFYCMNFNQWSDKEYLKRLVKEYIQIKINQMNKNWYGLRIWYSTILHRIDVSVEKLRDSIQ